MFFKGILFHLAHIKFSDRYETRSLRFGLGTNVGLKRIARQQPRINYDELRYVKQRFIQKDALCCDYTYAERYFPYSSTSYLWKRYDILCCGLPKVWCL